MRIIIIIIVKIRVSKRIIRHDNSVRLLFPGIALIIWQFGRQLYIAWSAYLCPIHNYHLAYLKDNNRDGKVAHKYHGMSHRSNKEMVYSPIVNQKSKDELIVSNFQIRFWPALCTRHTSRIIWRISMTLRREFMFIVL